MRDAGGLTDDQVFWVYQLPKLPVDLKVGVELLDLSLKLKVEGALALGHLVSHVEDPLEGKTGFTLPAHDLEDAVIEAAGTEFSLLSLLVGVVSLVPDVGDTTHVAFDVESHNVF